MDFEQLVQNDAAGKDEENRVAFRFFLCYLSKHGLYGVFGRFILWSEPAERVASFSFFSAWGIALDRSEGEEEAFSARQSPPVGGMKCCLIVAKLGNRFC